MTNITKREQIWSSHLWAPTTIFIGVNIAILSAIGHYILFHYLDGMTTEEAIPQSWSSNISHALARLFSLSLGTAATTAYTQLLWRLLRTNSLKVETIDTMLSATSNPSRLVSVSLMKLPTIFFFGLLLPLIPIGAIFPPSTLVVQPKSRLFQKTMAVPIFDPAYRGDKTFGEMTTNAIYADGSNGFSYQAPRGKIQSVAKRVMLGGEILSIASPCGSNCSYSITMPGPSFECEESSDTTIFATWELLKGNTVSMPPCVNYLAFSSISNRTFVDADPAHDYFRFDVHYPVSMYRSGRGVNITCVAFASEYRVDLSFVNNIQTIRSHVRTLNPLNATVLPSVGLGGDLVGVNGTEVLADDFPVALMGNLGLAFTYSQLNQLAIVQSLADYTLAGAISCYEIGQDQELIDTLILQSPLTLANNTMFTVGLTPSLLEELLRNVTISTLSLRNTTTQTEVHQTLFYNTYHFAGRRVLVLAYGMPLGFSLIFIALGVVALFRNGQAAEVGGFFQLLHSTRGDDLRINRLARRCAESTNVGGGCGRQAEEDLKGLRVRFGALAVPAGMSMMPMMGFGTEDELVPLTASGTTYNNGEVSCVQNGELGLAKGMW